MPLRLKFQEDGVVKSGVGREDIRATELPGEIVRRHLIQDVRGSITLVNDDGRKVGRQRQGHLNVQGLFAIVARCSTSSADPVHQDVQNRDAQRLARTAEIRLDVADSIAVHFEQPDRLTSPGKRHPGNVSRPQIARRKASIEA